MFFEYNQNTLFWEEINIGDLLQKINHHLKDEYDYEGAFFVYNKKMIIKRIFTFQEYFPKSKLYFSVKSLSNIHILENVIKELKVGLDVVSGGELLRAVRSGYSGDQIVFAGVGKTSQEIKTALQCSVKSIHVESLSELKKIEEIISSENKTAQIALRLNPNISVSTHKYIRTANEEDKFGLNEFEVSEAVRLIHDSDKLSLQGFHIHLGSQIMDAKPYEKAFVYLMTLLKKYSIPKPAYLSLGGGFGIDYSFVFKDQRGKLFPLESLAKSLKKLNVDSYQIDFEPGRYISAPTGILVCKVLYLKPRKKKNIAIVNAGMTEILRPALYQTRHPILNVKLHSVEKRTYDIVGPICESGDFLAKSVRLPRLNEDDALIVAYAGAYSSVMGSNYNSRPFAPEILVEDEKNFKVIRRPQKEEDIFREELA